MTPHARGTPHPRDRGAASVLVIGVVAAILLLTVGALTLAGVVAASHRARLAADLAAIAAAMELQASRDEGSACERGATIAASNAAYLKACGTEGLDVTITVEVTAPRWPAPATARAKAGPARS